MRPDRLIITLGLIILGLGAVVAGVGYVQIEQNKPVNVMDTSRAREIVPGVRNELGAVLENIAHNDRVREARRRALPWLYTGGGVAALGGIVVVVGLFTGRRPPTRA